MPTVYRRAAVRRDLVEHFAYLAENAGMDTAERSIVRVLHAARDWWSLPGIDVG